MITKFSLSLRMAVALGWFCALSLLSGCQSLQTRQLAAPMATHEFSFDAARDDVVGSLQVVTATAEDTLSDIARRFNLGYEEIVSANPGVDPWLPGAGTRIVIPSLFVLPDAPREGIVINLAAMRLFYFPKVAQGAPQRVITHPLGIGRVGWRTPIGSTRIVAKQESPSWIPTPSIRKEHAENGDPLPAIVPPGPDNPMGSHVLRLGWPKYSIHGTDKPPSIGLRGSHGCLRMYPEDIPRLYAAVPVGTPVRVVNQPQLFGWRGDTLYFQAYPVLEDDRRDHDALLDQALSRARTSAKADVDARRRTLINLGVLQATRTDARVIATPITQPELTVQAYLAGLPQVQNRLPIEATWNGDMRGQLTAADVREMAE